MFKKTIKNNLVRIVAYTMTMVLLGYGYFEAAAENDEIVVIQEEPVATSAYTNVWRSGCYDPADGKFHSWDGRISHQNYDEVVAGGTYKATLTMPGVQMLIRELDENYGMIRTDNLVNEQEIVLAPNAKYVGLSLYTPGNDTTPFEEYINMFESGMVADFVLVSAPEVVVEVEAVPEVNAEEVASPEESVVVEEPTEETSIAIEETEEEALAEESEVLQEQVYTVEAVQSASKSPDLFESNWKTGCYDPGNGKYRSWEGRICHVDYDAVSAGAQYVATISDSKYTLLIREMGSNFEFLGSKSLKNGDKVTLSKNTYYVGVSLYCPTDGKVTFDQYRELFVNGFTATFSSVTSTKEETAPEVSQKGQEVVSEFSKKWKSGCYALSTGKYTQCEGRICHVDYDAVEADATYKAVVSDKNYHVLVRELNSNYGYITSYDLKNGETVTLSNQTAYVGISVYNPSSSKITFAEYEKMFANGFNVAFEFVSSKPVTKIDTSFSNVWKSGCYAPQNGVFQSWEGRISHVNYDEVVAGVQYKANISVKGYNLLVRELDSNKKLLKSSNLTDGQTVTMSQSTKYVGISVYCPSNGKVTYEQYAAMFNEGFNPTLTKVESAVVEVETPIIVTAPAKGTYSGTPIVANPQTIRDELKNMILTGDPSSHDVSKYNMTYQEIQKVWDDLVANECYLAAKTYASAFIQTKKNSAGIVTSINIYSADSDFANRYIRVQQVVNDFVVYTAGMSQIEKALAAHEYIVSHTKYTKTGDLRQYSGGYVLGDGIGVCDGYASAFEILLHEVGMTTYRISSGDMNHAWNAVLIDGSYYMLDCTWDNTRQSGGANTHRYFIRTDSEFTSLSHYSWSCYKNSGLKCTNTKYSNWFVHDVSGQMYYYNGYWYYLDKATNCIVKSTITGTNKSVVVNGNGLGTLKVTGISGGVLNYTASGVACTKSLK